MPDLTSTMVTFMVQGFIEHEKWDDQDESKDFEEKLAAMTKQLERVGTVHLESMEPE